MRRDWEASTGGAPVVGLLGDYEPCDVEGLLLSKGPMGCYGLVTWAVRGRTAEIVSSLHAEP